MEINKGQKVWVHTDFCGLIETEIITIGRKYITVKQWKMKFDKKTFKEVNACGSPSTLIFDLDEYKRKCELNKLRVKIHRFNWDKLDIERLEKVYEIIKDL